MSHLQLHWRKFLRWAGQTHLHGEVDRAAQVEEFNDATQQENEDPNTFYSRLSMLAIGIGRKLTTDDIFPKLLMPRCSPHGGKHTTRLSYNRGPNHLSCGLTASHQQN